MHMDLAEHLGLRRRLVVSTPAESPLFRRAFLSWLEYIVLAHGMEVPKSHRQRQGPSTVKMALDYPIVGTACVVCCNTVSPTLIQRSLHSE